MAEVGADVARPGDGISPGLWMIALVRAGKRRLFVMKIPGMEHVSGYGRKFDAACRMVAQECASLRLRA